MSKEKIKVYLYTRVSTSIQIDGYSLEAQKSRMKAFALYNVVLCQEIVQDKKRKFYYPARTSFSLDWLVRYNFSNSLGDKYPQ